MYTPFERIENDSQLWSLPRAAQPVENKDGKYFRMETKGLEYV